MRSCVCVCVSVFLYVSIYLFIAQSQYTIESSEIVYIDCAFEMPIGISTCRAFLNNCQLISQRLPDSGSLVHTGASRAAVQLYLHRCPNDFGSFVCTSKQHDIWLILSSDRLDSIPFNRTYRASIYWSK